MRIEFSIDTSKVATGFIIRDIFKKIKHTLYLFKFTNTNWRNKKYIGLSILDWKLEGDVRWPLFGFTYDEEEDKYFAVFIFGRKYQYIRTPQYNTWYRRYKSVQEVV